MKTLIFIHGPNGVGKSTTCELLHERLENSAWLESEWVRRINPFTFSPEIERATEENMTVVLKNYFSLTNIEFVIFNWGLHGPRKRIFEKVLDNLKCLQINYVPILITCSEEENIKRMICDNRSDERIKRNSLIRELYKENVCFTIDTTFMTTSDVVGKIEEYVLKNK